MAPQRVISINSRWGTWVLIQATSSWKYATPPSAMVRPLPSARRPNLPQARDEFVVRWAMRKTPMGTMPVSECRRRSRK
jgi:hypothetical protein